MALDPSEVSMTLGEHLDELLKRTRRLVGWVLLGAIVGYSFADPIMAWLQAPFFAHQRYGAELIYGPLEKVLIYMKVSVIAGIFAVSPLIFWEVAAFVGPGLKKHEKSRVLYLMFWVGVCAVGGILLGYYGFLPYIVDFLFGVEQGRERAVWTVGQYISLPLGLMLASGVMLMLPVMMFHSTLWGWVDVSVWSKGRRFAIVINAVVSAILSPPDLVSMFVFMLPIQILYEAGYLGACVAKWVNGSQSKGKELVSKD